MPSKVITHYTVNPCTSVKNKVVPGCTCTTYFGVEVVFGEVPGLGGPAVSVGECPQTLQSLGHHAGEPLLPRQLGDEEDVLRSIHLV